MRTSCMRRFVRLGGLITVLVCMAAGCGKTEIKSDDISLTDTGDTILLYAEDLQDKVNHFTVFEAAEGIVPDAGHILKPYINVNLDVSESVVELIGVPPVWDTITLNKRTRFLWMEPKINRISLLSKSSGPFSPIPADLHGGGSWFKRNWVIIIGLGFLFLYMANVYFLAWTQFAGEGGLAMFFGHLFLFLFLARRWEADTYYLYLGLLIAAFILYILGMGGQRNMKHPLHILFALLYLSVVISMYVILVREKDYESQADWSSADSIYMYLNAAEREQIELIDEQGGSLAVYAVTPGIQTHSLCFWSDRTVTPHAVQLIRAGKVVRTLKLGERPEGPSREVLTE